MINSMELKGINSCQTPLLINSKILTSSTNMNSNTWCPSLLDTKPYVLISLSNLTYLTRLNIKSISSEFYYHIEYTRENLINQYTVWRPYNLLNNKQENISLNPPMIVKHIRLNIKQLNINICIQFELFGCIFTDGVISYNMLQGTNQLEDDTYDGEYNEKHHYLYNGLGQLSDGQTGPDNHQDPDGFQWVGWRKTARSIKSNQSIGILFTFDTLRNFSRMTIHANNYYPKKIFVFHSILIEFINHNHSSYITYKHQHDNQYEMARPIIINLKYHIAKQIKIHFYFDHNWILISEITFDSYIIPINNLIINKQIIHFSFYIIIFILIIITIFILLIIIILIRRILNKKKFNKLIHNNTDSFASTKSSQIDINSSQHRYATIRSIHPYLIYTNENIIYPHYAKLIPTTNLLRSPTIIQQNHIEGICGNSTYGTERLFTFNLKQNQFISSEKIIIKQQIDNKHQMIGGGEIYQGELQVNQTFIPINIRRLFPTTSIESKISFLNEISLLTSLCHPNIIHAYGLCSEPNLSLLTESFDQSTIDLHQYLQQYKQEEPLLNTLYTTTLFFSKQISSALAYLESIHIYHRDIATRNCFITCDFNIKLHDLAMCNEIYADDYVLITIENNIQTRRSIRWCAWETICLNQFTTKSDVFSFGVLVWEILTMGERPHRLLNDEQVLNNLRNCNHYLNIPLYADDLTDLILSCWNKYDYDRPSFYQLNYFLTQKQQQQQLTMKSHNYQQID